MLIAIMGAAYEQTLENTHFALKEQMTLLSDWAWTLQLVQKLTNKEEKINFMFAVAPAEEAEEDLNSKINQLREEMEEKRHAMKEDLETQAS